MRKTMLPLDVNNNIPYYDVTKKELAEIEKIYEEMFPEEDAINSRTVYKRKHSRIAGLLGEYVFQKVFPDAVKSEKDLKYDFLLDGKRVDVKCKYRTVVPKLEYEASFFYYQSNKYFDVDVYYFMSTIPDFSRVWFCGWGTKDGILGNKNMEIWKGGTTDPSNGMRFIKDTVCLKYKYLERVL